MTYPIDSNKENTDAVSPRDPKKIICQEKYLVLDNRTQII